MKAKGQRIPSLSNFNLPFPSSSFFFLPLSFLRLSEERERGRESDGRRESCVSDLWNISIRRRRHERQGQCFQRAQCQAQKGSVFYFYLYFLLVEFSFGCRENLGKAGNESLDIAFGLFIGLLNKKALLN